ncbi:TPA: hypothetical protein KM359_002062 [Clostridioides difficile]|nr:hypothetical protein [Clostridioides difficile]
MEIHNLFWGFILTIWNVNDIKDIIPFMIPDSFILTIWNVNLCNGSVFKIETSSFILTIWNVNQH